MYLFSILLTVYLSFTLKKYTATSKFPFRALTPMVLSKDNAASNTRLQTDIVASCHELSPNSFYCDGVHWDEISCLAHIMQRR
jgi:hypothetical protein